MIHTKLFSCAAATMFLTASVAVADDIPDDGAYAVVAEFTRDLHGMSASFGQQVFDDMGRLVETSSGQVYLSEPNRFRWDYREPFEQYIIADGDKVWVYDVELEQVTVRDQGAAESESPLSVLAQPERLAEHYDVSSMGDGWVRLAPRGEDAQVEKVDLRFDHDRLVAMEIHDSFGQRTSLTFSEQHRNPELAQDLFRFSPPDGVDVLGDIDGVLPTNTSSR